MTFTTVLQPTELAAHLAEQAPDGTGLVIFDCSFDLTDVDAGKRAYESGHIPGAVYMHLDADLSGLKTGRNGRHPLPERAQLRQRLEQAGVSDDTQIVVYDASIGMVAARLWWLARWIGHERVALLDGGLAAWQAAGLATQAGPPADRPPGRLSTRAPRVTTVEREAVLDNLQTGERLVVDARAADRFCGENETLDPVAGHIPGARNRLFRQNIGADGRFKPAEQLRAEFGALAGGRPVPLLVMQCGSGVTACHNLLALEIAGLPGAALYPGSWSEWCAFEDAPVALGAD